MDLTTTHTANTRPKTYSGISKRSCPDCTARLVRIARRPVDRLQSLFVPVKRYRCRTFMCSWEGNLPWSAGASTVASGAGDDGSVSSGSAFDRTPLLIAICCALVAGAIVLVFLLGSTGADAATWPNGAAATATTSVGFAGSAPAVAAHEPPGAVVVRPARVAATETQSAGAAPGTRPAG